MTAHPKECVTATVKCSNSEARAVTAEQSDTEVCPIDPTCHPEVG